MSRVEKILCALIIITGIFYFKISNLERFFPAQEGLFISCGIALWSCILYRRNKWLGLLMGLFSFGYLKTYLFCHSPQPELFRFALLILAGSLIYYFSREYKLKADILKLLLIPAFLNIILIFIQAFDHRLIPFLPVAGVTGFLGNKSQTAYYLAIISPLFFKYHKKSVPLVLLAIFLCKSFFGLLALFVVGFIYLFFEHKKFLKLILPLLILSVITILILFKTPFIEQAKFRLCMWFTTFDGIKFNPILGWGIGSYETIVSRIKPGEMIYFGKTFNSAYIVNHPHNELLFGWWNLGIGFPILFILLLIDIFKKFIKDNLVIFLMLLSGIICIMGSFLISPIWFLLMTTLAIYENKKEEYDGQEI